MLQNYRHTEAVKALAGRGIPVHGLLVSAGRAKFCPELVESVAPLEQLAAHLSGLTGADDSQADLAILQGKHLEQLRAHTLVK